MEPHPYPVELVDGVWFFSFTDDPAPADWREQHSVKGQASERCEDAAPFPATVYLEKGSATRGFVPDEAWKG